MTERGPGGPRPFAHYDSRRYQTLSIEQGYTIWSRCYGDLDDRLDLDLVAGSPLLRERTVGARVVDLACGNGRIGRWLAARGARRLVGVDRTDAMLAAARGRGPYSGLVRAEIRATPLATSSFDGAVCSMALCHVGDLAGFFREARRLLRPGGWLAVVDYHPAFLLRGIPTHFDHPDTGVSIAIENHVHALRDFFQLPSALGLVVREMEERFVDDEWIEALPNFRPHLGWPVTHFWAYEAA